MELSRPDLDRAVAAGILSAAQANALWDSLSAGPPQPEPAPVEAAAARGDGARRTAVTLAMSCASCVASGLLVLVGWERLGSDGGTVLAIACAASLLGAARFLVRHSLVAAASVHVTAAIGAVAAAAYGVQHWAGLDPGAGAAPPDTLGAWIASDDFPGVVAGALAAGLALRVFRLPFLSAVFVLATWFVAMDGAPIVFGPDPSWDQRALLSSLVGALAMGAGLAADRRTSRDHATWLYFGGLVALCGALATAQSTSSLWLGAVVNGGLVVTSMLLRRRVFAVFGGLGLADVGGRFAHDLLVAPAVPVAVVLIGAAVASGAWAYHRWEPGWARALRASFPDSLQRLLPPPAAFRP